MTGAFALRAALASDAQRVAEVSRESRTTFMPWLPTLHTPAEDLNFFQVELESSDFIVAEVDGEMVGFGCVREGWLNHLYLLPEFTNRGIGTAILAALPQAQSLWTFQRNVDARRFYARHGWVEVELTDGSGNEEREPDVRLVRG